MTFRTVSAWITAGIAAFAFVAGAIRFGEDRRENVIADLPVFGSLSPGDGPIALGSLLIDLREHSDTGDCFVRVAAPGAVDTTIPDGPGNTCPPVRVRYDAVNALAVIENVPLWRAPYDERAWDVIGVHSTRDGAALPVDTVPRVRRAPPDWAAVAAIASVLAVALLRAAFGQRRRAVRLASLAEATHEGDGWFALSDGRRFRVPSVLALELGPFSVRVLEPSAAGAYRASSATTVEPVEPGKPDDLVREARDRATTYEGIALAAGVIGIMPALAALRFLMF